MDTDSDFPDVFDPTASRTPKGFAVVERKVEAVVDALNDEKKHFDETYKAMKETAAKVTASPSVTDEPWAVGGTITADEPVSIVEESSTSSDADEKASSEPLWHTPYSAKERGLLREVSRLSVLHKGKWESFTELLRSRASGYEKPKSVFSTGVLRRDYVRGQRYSLDALTTRLGRRVKVREYQGVKQSDMTHFYADAGRNAAVLRSRGHNVGLFGFLPDANVLPLIVQDVAKSVKTTGNDDILQAVEANTDRSALVRYLWSTYSGQFYGEERPSDVSDDLLSEILLRDQPDSVTSHSTDVDDLQRELLRSRYQENYELPAFVYVEGDENAADSLGEESDDSPEDAGVSSEDKGKGKGKAKDRAYLRPNGERYYARKIIVPGNKKAVYDVELIQTAREARINILLKGRPGTGKTALSEAAFDNLQVVECDASTESADFLGSYVPTGVDSFEWRDGPLIVAAKNGWPLLVDEIALCDTRELAVLYSAMDGRTKITVTSNPEIGEVDIQEGFYVIGACNPDVPGAVLSDALLSRFPIQLEVTTDYEMLKKLGVEDSIITVARNLAKQEASKEIMRAPQTRELLDFMRVKSVFGLHAAIASFVASADSIDMDTYVAVVSAAFGIKAAPIKI